LLTKSIARFTKFQKLPPILSGIKQLKFERFARKDLVTQEIKCFSQTNFSLEVSGVGADLGGPDCRPRFLAKIPEILCKPSFKR